MTDYKKVAEALRASKAAYYGPEDETLDTAIALCEAAAGGSGLDPAKEALAAVVLVLQEVLARVEALPAKWRECEPCDGFGPMGATGRKVAAMCAEDLEETLAGKS